MTHGPERFSGLDALRLATSEGAKALGLDADIGSIEVGKKADLLALATDRPEWLAAPSVDLHDMVVFGASRASVRHVWVGGQSMVEGGRLVSIDLPTVRRNAMDGLEALLKRAHLF